VQWYWMGDNGWVKYDAVTNLKLEISHQAGKEKIPVDKDWFVDCSTGPAYIKKNFQQVDCPDRELVGMQRRKDDEMKRRAVRRETPPPFFKGTAVFIALSDDSKRNEIASTIQTYGGTVRKSVTKRTDAVISTTEDLASCTADIEQAKSFGIPVISEQWIVDSMKDVEQKELANATYQVQEKTKPKKVAAPPDEDDEPTLKGSKKRPASDLELERRKEHEEEEKKHSQEALLQRMEDEKRQEEVRKQESSRKEKENEITNVTVKKSAKCQCPANCGWKWDSLLSLDWDSLSWLSNWACP